MYTLQDQWIFVNIIKSITIGKVMRIANELMNHNNIGWKLKIGVHVVLSQIIVYYFSFIFYCRISKNCNLICLPHRQSHRRFEKISDFILILWIVNV